IFSMPGRYYHNPPEYYGASWNMNEEPNELPSNIKSPENNVLGRAATVTSAFKHFMNYWVGNFSNISIWEATSDEQRNRRAFYKATNIVDSYQLGDKTLTNPKGRANLINFLTDGTLPKNTSIESKLRIFFTGYQIMSGNDIKLRDK